MATSTSTETKSASWWNYFFLYDGSKVKGEGDPTRAGICYFFPPQTLLDQQELLCGQIAGVVHCISDISGSPPTVIRLRKLKFAIKVDGDYLWVLGCAVELPDVSCKQLLDQLIGFFNFYNGPVSLAYKSCSREELSGEWDTFIDQILRNTGDLHRIFNSLWNLDRTKVEPLLLLKAALILQTCQRSPHVLAGCILYKGLIVSTQLPPSVTAKVLLHRAARRDQRTPVGGDAPQEHGAALPPDVQIVPVFLTEEEAVSLREFPREPMTSTLASPARLLEPPAQRPPKSLNTSAPKENTPRHAGSTARISATTPEPRSPDVTWPNGSGENGHWSGCDLKSIKPPTLHHTTRGQGPGLGLSLVKETGLSRGEEELDLSEIHVPEAQDTGASLGYSASDGGPPGCRASVSDSGNAGSKPPEALPVGTAVGGPLPPSTPGMLTQNGALERPRDLPGNSSQAPVPRDHLLGPASGPLPSPCLDSRQTGTELPVGEQGEGQRGDGVPEGRSASGPERTSGSADPPGDGPSADRPGSRATPASRTRLVRMNLYTHSVRGLVLLLLAEEPLLGDGAAVEDVYHGSLASLNGLEVHLNETLPWDQAAPAARAYGFAHYDRVQNVLAANLPQVATAQDRRFLQAVSLMHSDFARLPALYEVTVRNASTAVYACCSPVQETYFQQLASAGRSSGFPSPQDSAFSLPGKAKQKLLKHGVNLL
ncbi:BLOC-3 complex member HPS4 [Balaenoptera acutorostrata]|uniref:BLOC-3 complex member HPS4 n=1 Tax=Balaenoptera acutorostrata TaxID=9767 RepID=A0A384A101_BALAC|nr:BLOC-3 complex member HPS4 [Balaenoptera acutorostrata]XP_057382060.1 BLOC-3 complex member HPS4 [Balaenoptera acutorostrata]XP_057382062.1 BLOC-3 complex member HPS4 [Balaenoptera acutorostrata]XP_057382063.1 BLOC-3 complex member HPS4 [Balaenoptera acutorostrata]XP_057382064.1 BLOC-3 complex member HPS4 [Balaenoptera acutorostrata]XP_057382065.1 BLOC-3 complex member HPS4 [Balaenoptera acutorostrata]